ncbi:hypothetical protein SODALDRAFT_360497 [Sodiomyces alkalinus F11]|uniref:Uncharacterized protein n=1 Tax=Sodiomyces alkalinus (strain CBS 110278 / VKM F-3762 / F11) TaxID=1314773 RepID=A0A3N2PUG5_SODAK|nr:hypothetical protein SODALDRAFT_360497 [Sodiomyces alkalinus F11]ROT38158.1 hypothetical protein SODALDRAFT_360497 [Sodiomyces alkalinus F11]
MSSQSCMMSVFAAPVQNEMGLQPSGRLGLVGRKATYVDHEANPLPAMVNDDDSSLLMRSPHITIQIPLPMLFRTMSCQIIQIWSSFTPMPEVLPSQGLLFMICLFNTLLRHVSYNAQYEVPSQFAFLISKRLPTNGVTISHEEQAKSLSPALDLLKKMPSPSSSLQTPQAPKRKTQQTLHISCPIAM